uniref:Uncharacterized protein MANES_05G082600 n=1 Tax=Rhizophora mucronata TaxID=61149 RepID=A0A2P2LZ91_RHIMU
MFCTMKRFSKSLSLKKRLHNHVLHQIIAYENVLLYNCRMPQSDNFNEHASEYPASATL